MPPTESSKNPYSAPQTPLPSHTVRRPVSAADFPWYRRSFSFVVVFALHIASWVARDLLSNVFPAGRVGANAGTVLICLSAMGIVAMCVIALIGPIYIRDYQGRWWQSGWADKLLAFTVGSIFTLMLLAIIGNFVREYFVALRSASWNDPQRSNVVRMDLQRVPNEDPYSTHLQQSSRATR